MLNLKRFLSYRLRNNQTKYIRIELIRLLVLCSLILIYAVCKSLGFSLLRRMGSTPLQFAYSVHLPCIYATMSISVTFDPGCLTTKALGSSPASESGIPMTAASAISGCFRRRSSRNAGATC